MDKCSCVSGWLVNGMQGISALSFSSCARYDAIDGIANPEVGQWPGVRRRLSP
jgi:hypothetical protein